MRSAIKIIRLVTAATFLVMALVPGARAQETDDGNPRRECRLASGSDRSRCESDAAGPDSVATIFAVPRQAVLFEQARLPLTQIDEDLGYLQTVGQLLSHTAARGDDLDFKAIVKTASEVSRRARRLEDNLALPSLQNDAREREWKVIEETGQLREALSALSALLADAVRNPVLRGYLLAPAMSARARRELDEVVELSRLIKVASEVLVKAEH